MTEDSGTIAFEDGFIRYRSPAYGSWDLPLSSVLVLGESTNQNGPFTDDYFVCVAVGREGWYEFSFYATGRDEALHAISERLGAPIQLGLAASVDFASRVLWPPELAGTPMFKYEKERSGNWLRRVLGLSRMIQTFSDPVDSLLRRGAGQPPT